MPDCRGLWERRSREGRSVGLCEGGDRSYAGKSEPTERAMSENRPTRTYDDECPKHPVFGDCALVDGPLFGGRPNCRLQHLRPDRPHHASGSHRTEPIENADRSKRKGASRYTVLRGRSAATSALDNGDLLIEDLKAEYPALNLSEIANIGYVRFGRRPEVRTVRRVLEEEPIPLKILKRFAPYHEIEEAKERRMVIVKLHAEGWSVKAIAGST